MGARVKLGFGIAEFICNFSQNEKNSAKFWRNLSAATMLFDTLVDYKKDRRDGLAKDARLKDFVSLIGKIVAFGCKAVAELGVASSVRHLFVPVLFTITGGFENERKKEKEWLIFEPKKRISRNAPITA